MKPYQKLVLAASISALFTLPSTLHAQTMLYEYNFNAPEINGWNAPSTGSVKTDAQLYQRFGTSAATRQNLHGAPGSGVSGLAGDLAFDNTESTQMGGGSTVGEGGLASIANSGALEALTSFTMQGWYQVGAEVPATHSNGRIFVSNHLTLLSNRRQSGNVETRLTAEIRTPTLGTTFTTVNSDYSILLGEDDWVFFAITYDSTLANNNLSFYAGTTEDAAVLVSQHDLLGGATGTGFGNLLLGNNSAYSRPFDGLLDNFRIFGSSTDGTGALSLAQLEAYRHADAIPEPGIVGLTALGAAAALVARRKHSRTV